ncbi:MAG: heavy-metal-associated domain-containing protein [Gemmataceae bacterium]|nr:heavy-metal-associated domain-containing protein [Gemmataceae bacterium]
MFKLAGFLTAVTALGLVLMARAQERPPAYTVITVEKMHCANGAKRIGNKLYEVAGVKSVQADVAKKKFWVHPEPGKQPSPRDLWDAVEKASDRPTRLHGPLGVFVQKPQS